MHGSLVALHSPGTDIIFSFLSPSHSHLPGGLRGSKPPGFLAALHTHSGGDSWETASVEREAPSRKHCRLRPGDTRRWTLHNSSESSPFRGRKGLARKCFWCLWQMLPRSLRRSEGRCFWFVVDHLCQVGFTLWVWDATGLWRLTGRTEELAMRCSGLQRKCPLSAVVGLPPFLHSWESSFLSCHLLCHFSA